MANHLQRGAWACGLLALGAGCPGKDTPDDSAPLGGWTVLAEGLPGALLSLWAPEGGASGEELWTVGGDVGEGPLVLHLSGGAWTQVNTGSTGDLWWVWGDGANVWMVGEAGRVLRHDPSTGSFAEQTLDSALTLFGVWGSSPTDIWAVGGDINVASDGAAVWHYDGLSWTEAELPAEAAAHVAVYKVWGSGPSDVWAVGTAGLILRWDGSAWTQVPSPTTRNLFTVHGDASRLYAVGGAVGGTILAWDGSAWGDITPALAPQLNGVYTRGGCPAQAAGTQGFLFQEGDEGWEQDPRGSATPLDFHALRVDESCAAWAVGGSIASFPLDQGLIVYGGSEDMPEVELP